MAGPRTEPTYYVMEYLPGLSLAELVERHGPLPPGRVVYLLRQVCLALHEAHGAGLIHRDIKPSNIFAAHRGGLDDVAKLLDFGLVRPSSPSNQRNLSGVGPVGTPAFMSPEQILGDPKVDPRSDIYSLGAVAYYLLTGRPPFPQRGGMAALIAHVRDPVVPPSKVQSDVPADLERRRAGLPGQGARGAAGERRRRGTRAGRVRLRRRLGQRSGSAVVASGRGRNRRGRRAIRPADHWFLILIARADEPGGPGSAECQSPERR